MTDQEIIQGLIARDNQVTEEFFFVRCRPLFLSIIQKVFNSEMEYDEFVNELYLYLMADDAEKLRQFKYRSSVYQWLKVVTTRFFIKKRQEIIESSRCETLYGGQAILSEEPANRTASTLDLERLFSLMPNQRYASVVRRLIIEDREPEQLAEEMNTSVDNLYNIKRRALAQLTRVALNDIKYYGSR